MTTATKTGNPIERIKDEKPGLDILDDINELAAQHGGWETIEAGDRAARRWSFSASPLPAQVQMRV